MTGRAKDIIYELSHKNSLLEEKLKNVGSELMVGVEKVKVALEKLEKKKALKKITLLKPAF